jgi:hypothetical protein
VRTLTDIEFYHKQFIQLERTNMKTNLTARRRSGAREFLVDVQGEGSSF